MRAAFIARARATADDDMNNGAVVVKPATLDAESESSKSKEGTRAAFLKKANAVKEMREGVEPLLNHLQAMVRSYACTAAKDGTESLDLPSSAITKFITAGKTAERPEVVATLKSLRSDICHHLAARFDQLALLEALQQRVAPRLKAVAAAAAKREAHFSGYRHVEANRPAK